MGNRAIIKGKGEKIGLYLHWNGGKGSVTAFLKYCEFRGFRSLEEDSYGLARLAQIVGNFFGGGLSVGIIECGETEAKFIDNGIYIVEKWKEVAHIGTCHEDDYDVLEMIKDIDAAQPEKERLGDKLEALFNKQK